MDIRISPFLLFSLTPRDRENLERGSFRFAPLIAILSVARLASRLIGFSEGDG